MTKSGKTLFLFCLLAGLFFPEVFFAQTPSELSKEYSLLSGGRRTLPVEEGLPEVIKKTQPSVVNIQTDRFFARYAWRRPGFFNRFLDDFFEKKTAGGGKIRFRGEASGVVIDPAGLILTNAHVISGAPEVRVVTYDKREFAGTIIGQIPEYDLALLKVKSEYPWTPIVFGKSELAAVGETVIAIGTPLGYSHTVSKGIISALHRELKEGNRIIFKDMIQTDASVNPGNSGGPLLNEQGQMIGMTTVGDRRAYGINFSIPTETIEKVLPSLKTASSHLEKAQRFSARYGFVPREMTGEAGDKQIQILDVKTGASADKAGLRSGDLLRRFNHGILPSLESLFSEGDKVRTGKRVYLEIERRGRIFFTYLEVP